MLLVNVHLQEVFEGADWKTKSYGYSLLIELRVG